MKICSKLFLMILLLPLFTTAQINLKPGYVVTIKGDTIRGQIDYKEWYGNPASINFKDQSGLKKYTANDINYFELVDIIAYQRYSGYISTDETNESRLSRGADSGKKQEVVFLRIEQKGPHVILYSYTDGIKTRYLIGENSSGNIKELIYRKYVLPEGGDKTREENIFISTLYQFAEKYNPASESLRQEIIRSDYSLSNLKSIAQKINNMDADHKPYGSGTTFVFFAGLGVNYNIYTTSGTFPFNFAGPNKSSVFPILSAGINFYPNKQIGKLVIRGEIQLTGSNFKQTVQLYFQQPEKPTSDYAIKQFVVVISPQVLYNIYNTQKFKFYAGGGLSISLTKSTGNTIYNAFLNTITQNYLTLSSVLISFPLKLGVVLNKKMDINVCYYTPSSITNNQRYTVDVSGVKAGINYQF